MLPQLGLLRAHQLLCRAPSWLGQSDLRVNGKSNPVLDCIISPLGLKKICKRGGMMNLMSFLSPWVSLPGRMTWSISLQLQSSSHCCGCNGNSFCVADPARLLSTFTYRRKGEGKPHFAANLLPWTVRTEIWTVCAWILAGWFLWKACVSHFNFSSFLNFFSPWFFFF